MKLFNLFKNKEKPADAKVIYRVDILRYAKKHKKEGLCSSIGYAIEHYDLPYVSELKYYIPLFTRGYALRFDADGNRFTAYWWKAGEWNTGREDYLDWLIEQYKDDKTNLRYYGNNPTLHHYSYKTEFDV